MKSIKVIVPIVAFAIGIVTAFASSTASFDIVRGHRSSDSMCVTGSLVTPPIGRCNTANTIVRCQVIVVAYGEFEVAAAFANDGTCNQELYYDPF